MTTISTRGRALATTILVAVLVPALAGCFGSDLQRHTVDLADFRAWAGQSAETNPDTLIASLVPIRSQIPEFRSGSVVGVEEVSLFVQLQNADDTVADVTVYAHRERLANRARLVREGVPITQAIRVAPLSAVQIDARSYPIDGANFDAFVDLITASDVYLFVVADSDEFNVAANVPSLSLLVTID